MTGTTTRAFQLDSARVLSSAPTSPTRSYEWDAADQLEAMVSVISPSETRRKEFFYNGGGARVGKKEFHNGSLQSELKYIYGGTGVLQERSADGGTVLKTYTSRGELDFTTNPPTSRYFTRDHLGSVREVVAADGSLLARYDYKPYGERVLVSRTYEAAKGFKGSDGIIHRFSKPSNGECHWNGSTGGADPAQVAQYT